MITVLGAEIKMGDGKLREMKIRRFREIFGVAIVEFSAR